MNYVISPVTQPAERFRALTSQRFVLADTALEGMVNGKKVHGRRIYQMIDNIMINGPCKDTKRKAEKKVEWRMLSLQ